MRKIYLITLCILIVVSMNVFGAAFRQLSPLINIPTAKTFKAGDVEFLGAVSIANASNNSTTSANKTIDHDFDFMVNYAITDRLKTGLAFLHQTGLAGYAHATVFDNGILGIGTGLTHMTGKKALSSREEFSVTKENSFTSYVTFSLNIFAGYLHFGFGNKEFISVEGSNGYFYGLELEGLGGSFLLENDGRNINFGYRINAADQTTVYIAHTEIDPLASVNEEYNNAPKRYFAFAASIRQNLSNFYASQQDEIAAYQKKFKDLEADYITLKEDIGLEKELFADSRRRFDQEVEDFKELMGRLLDEEREHISTANIEDPTDQYVLDLYNRSFEEYQVKNYYKAIEHLSDAIELKPEAAFLYVRLGSIYYEIGRKDLAVESWETALEYDPKNEELIQLLSQ